MYQLIILGEAEYEFAKTYILEPEYSRNSMEVCMQEFFNRMVLIFMEYEKSYCPRSLDDIESYETNYDGTEYKCLSTLDSVTITRKVGNSKNNKFKSTGPHILKRILFYGTNGGLSLEFLAAIIEICQ